MTSAIGCPVCNSNDTEIILHIPRSPSSDGGIIFSPSDTTVCHACGCAYNSTGARSSKETFYSEQYDMLPQSANAERTYASVTGMRGINSGLADFLLRHISFSNSEEIKILDVGCGKGVLLKALGERFPNAKLHGVEPSLKARKHSRELLPNAAIHVGYLQESPFINQKFDVVTCSNVLEHVESPLEFLKSLAMSLQDDGYLLLTVPNLECNPHDVATYDHLSKFTPGTLKDILLRAGLMLIADDAGERVPMWALSRRNVSTNLSKHGTQTSPNRSVSVARNSVKYFQSCIAAYETMITHSAMSNRKIAVYGTGLIAVSAICLDVFSPRDLTAFLDDNPYLHGSHRMGKPVLSVEQAVTMGLTDITFAANPIYLGKMQKRIELEGVNWRTWPLPSFSN